MIYIFVKVQFLKYRFWTKDQKEYFEIVNEQNKILFKNMKCEIQKIIENSEDVLVYSSPMKRSLETAHYVLPKDIQIFVDPFLAEISNNVLFAHNTLQEKKLSSCCFFCKI